MSATGEILVQLDWSPIDGWFFEINPTDPFKQANTYEIAAATVGWLTATKLDGLGVPVASLPVHLVGHSRGGSLVCELARLLGQRGIWIDQVTTLDPHPVCSDATVATYQNVIFADNYFQREVLLGSTDCVSLLPTGLSVVNAFNRQLTGLNGEGYINEHSDVHLWYRGTINLSTPAVFVEGGSLMTVTEAVRQEWWTASEERGAKTGFYFSRIGGGTRPASGLAAGFGGTAARVSVPRLGTQWPNIANVQLDDPDGVVTIGDSVRVNYRYQDYDSNATVQWYWDTDTNPLNGHSGSFSPSQAVSRTWDIISSYQVTGHTDSRTAGTFHVYAKIFDSQGQTRYAYADKQVQLVNPPSAQPGKTLSVQQVLWEETSSGADGDGVLEAGERVQLSVRLGASATVSGMDGTLSTSDTTVAISDGEIDFGPIPGGGSVWSDANVDIQVAPGSSRYVVFSLRVEYSSGGKPFYQDFHFTGWFSAQVSPNLVVSDLSIDDSPTISLRNNGDGILQSGEEARVSTELRNVGDSAATDIEMTVGYSGAAFTIPDGDDPDNYPDLDPLEESFPSSPTSTFRVNTLRSFAGAECVSVSITTDQQPGGVTLDCGLSLSITPQAWFQSTWPENGQVDLDFGVAEAGTLVARNMVIANSGSAPLTVTAIAENYADVSVTGGPMPLTIAPGESRTVVIELDTVGKNESLVRNIVVQTLNGRFYRSGIGIGSSQTVRLTGTVTDQVPSLYVKKETIDITEAAGIAALDGDQIVGMGVGDTDADGFQEIIALTYDSPNSPSVDVPKLYIFEKVADGTPVLKWTSSAIFSGARVFSGARNTVVRDVTGDGKSDVVFVINQNASGAGTAGKLVLVQSTGNDSWEVSWSGHSNVGRIIDVTVGDADSDGQSEILAVFTSGSTASVGVYEYAPGPSFNQIFFIPEIGDPSGDIYRALGSTLIADSDNDGINEILFVAGNRYDQFGADNDGDQLFIYECIGNNSFTKKYSGLSYQIQRGPAWDHAYLAVGDVDSDGKNELLLAEDDDHSLYVWEISGNDTWSTDLNFLNYEYKKGPFPTEPMLLEIGDTDGDGLVNIAVGLSANPAELAILESFAPDSYVEEWRSDNAFRDDLYSIAIGSYDAPGHFQFIAADKDGPLAVFEALSSVPFVTGSQLPNGNMQIIQTAVPGWRYVLQESFDLAAWTDTQTETAVSGTILFEVPIALGVPTAYYRILVTSK